MIITSPRTTNPPTTKPTTRPATIPTTTTTSTTLTTNPTTIPTTVQIPIQPETGMFFIIYGHSCQMLSYSVSIRFSLSDVLK